MADSSFRHPHSALTAKLAVGGPVLGRAWIPRRVLSKLASPKSERQAGEGAHAGVSGWGPLTSILPLGTVRRVRTVILLRHGKSNWSDPTLADLDRPVAPRGERASRLIAKYIRRKKIRPALVLCSPSLRTRQTLAAIEPSLGNQCSVEVEPQLYAASEGELLERLRALPESVESVMLIGHNPGLHELACALASGGDELPRLEQKFPTGALATLAIDSESWAALEPGGGELVDYVVPRQLG